MKIYGHPMSTCTRKVLTALAETGTPYEMVVVDFAKGEHKQPPHTDRQPFGQVPAMDDDGFAMYESRAMCRYIDEKAGHKLTPDTAKGRAVMEEWISIETSNFTPHVMKFIFHHIFHRNQEESVLAAAGTGLETALTVMDKQLANNVFLTGTQFTIADIGFMPYFEYAMNTPAKEIFAKHANVMAWWNRVSERPTWQKVAGRAQAS
jgi:glutathione S-transferase